MELREAASTERRILAACRLGLPGHWFIAAMVVALLASPVVLYHASWRFHEIVRRQLWPTPDERADQFFLHHQTDVPPQPPPPEQYDYRFTAAGHLRADADEPYPFIASYADAVPEMTTGSAALFVLGDIQTFTAADNWMAFDAVIRERSGAPVHLALGNHDVYLDRSPTAGIQWYTKNYGPAYLVRRIDRSQFLVVCTEFEASTAIDQQNDFVLEQLTQARDDSDIRHVFVMMHRALWMADEREDAVRSLLNDTSGPAGWSSSATRRIAQQFARGWLPILRDIARSKSVFVFSGDAGRFVPLLYEERDGIHLIATGCRSDRRVPDWNHVIDVYVAGESVHLRTRALGKGRLGHPARYDRAFWRGLDVSR